MHLYRPGVELAISSQVRRSNHYTEPPCIPPCRCLVINRHLLVLNWILCNISTMFVGRWSAVLDFCSWVSSSNQRTNVDSSPALTTAKHQAAPCVGRCLPLLHYEGISLCVSVTVCQLISAPSYKSELLTIDSVPLSVCHTPLNCFFFLFLDGIEPFFGRHFSMCPSTNRCSSIFDLGPLMPNIYSPKFAQNRL